MGVTGLYSTHKVPIKPTVGDASGSTRYKISSDDLNKFTTGMSKVCTAVITANGRISEKMISIKKKF